jgi:hypothetical protein
LPVTDGLLPHCRSSTGDASVNAPGEVLEEIGEIFEKWHARIAQVIDPPKLQRSKKEKNSISWRGPNETMRSS